MIRWWCAIVAAMGVVGVGSVQARPERVLRTEAIIDATPAQLWEAYTTKAGWESWAVPLAEVDFRLGGTIKTNYNKEAGIGGPGTITHHVVAFEPERMVATRFDAPENAGWAKLAQACQVVVRLEPVSPTRTRFVETMVGWGEGPQWDEAYEKFTKGNTWTLEQLRKKFEKPSDAEAVLKLMGSMVGGEWLHEHKGEDGRVFRARQVFETAPDGKGILGRGWLGDDSGMFYHGLNQVWSEGTEIMFQDVDQDGAVARGTVRLAGEHAVAWDWNQASAEGAQKGYTVTMTFDAPDAYTMVLTERSDDGPGKELVTLPLKRVPKAPAAFGTMRGATGATAKENPMSIDTSIFPASGPVENALVKEVVVKASPHDVFRVWTTAEGLRSFLEVDSNVNLRIGGPFELYFGGPEVPHDQRGSNGCQILSYTPGEMLSFSWNAPPKFLEERAQRAWVVLTFAPAGPGETKVRLVHTGFGTTGKWPEVRQYFDNAWANVLAALKKHYDE